MATRKSLAIRVLDAVNSERIRLVDAQRGWPALLEFEHEGRTVPVALFAGPIGDAYREDRRDIERRWQNPAAPKGADGKGLPIEIPPGHFPVLLGTWFDDPYVHVDRPVFAVADAVQREGKTTRHSIFAELAMLTAAAATGWAEGANSDDEPVTYFHPALLPAYLDLALMDVPFPTDGLAGIAAASGIVERDNEESRERARRQAGVLVRKARFGKDVVKAYDGLCAMCGLNLGLVEGAHIYPASAPGSPDIIPNGLALCPNHHSAFDKHLIAVDPDSFEIRLRSDLRTGRHRSEVSALFVDNTRPVLTRPTAARDMPDPEFFDRRARHFGEYLRWAR